MTLSFRARLATRWTLAFALLLSIAHVATYAAIRAFLLENLDADLRTVAATELASATDNPSGAHLHEFTPDPANPDYNQKFVQLLDSNGRLLMQSPRLGAEQPLLDRATVVRAFAGQAPVSTVRVGAHRGRMIGLVTRGADPYIVAVGLFTDHVDATLAWLRQLLIAVWIAATCLTALIGFVLASRALDPIRRITARAAAIAHGDFAARLDPPAVEDEIGRMTRLLNEMLARLFHAIDANRRFASDASHELRSPITAMLGEVEVTLKRPRTATEYRDALTVVRERLHRIAALTDDLMLLARAQERRDVAVREVALMPLLERARAGVADLARARDSIVEIDATDAVVYGDARLLERVFENLVRNAVQYSGDGGRVEVSAGVRPAVGEWASDEVIVRVRDHGPGIPSDHRERVFDRFHRVDESRSRQTGGTGLGLSIAREIVELFKGSIRVVDTDGPGATFEVRLPGGEARGQSAGQALRAS